MMTPRPDLYTYPTGKTLGGVSGLPSSWLRALFIGGLFGCAVLAVAFASAI